MGIDTYKYHEVGGNYKRREVAEALRLLVEDEGYEVFIPRMFIELGMMEGKSLFLPSSQVLKLADLIDADQCRNLATDGSFRCSVCEDWRPLDDAFLFCPTCGAEVIINE